MMHTRLRNCSEPPVGPSDLLHALSRLDGSFGVTAKTVSDQTYRITGFTGEFAVSEQALDRKESALPLSPLSDTCARIAASLVRPGEGLPLVTATAAQGAFRSTVAMWITGDDAQPIESKR